MKSERYEFDNMVIDVVTDSSGDQMIPEGQFGLIWMKPSKVQADGEEAHDVIEFERFYDITDLEEAEMGLKLLSNAQARNIEYEEKDKKSSPIHESKLDGVGK